MPKKLTILGAVTLTTFSLLIIIGIITIRASDARNALVQAKFGQWHSDMSQPFQFDDGSYYFAESGSEALSAIQSFCKDRDLTIFKMEAVKGGAAFGYALPNQVNATNGYLVYFEKK